jgi:transcriptional regulator with XRE-family HTH domain
MPHSDATVLGDYLTDAQLAKELGVSTRTLMRWEAARYGPPRIIVGRKLYYRREAVEKWLLGRERGVEPPPKRQRRA